MSSRYSRSDSVKGLSTEVTKRTRSLRGTKPRDSSFLVADDRVGPRRVHDGDLAQQRVRVALLQNPLPKLPLRKLRAVPKDGDAVGRGRYAFFGEPGPQEGIDERRLTRVELADDDERFDLSVAGNRQSRT